MGFALGCHEDGFHFRCSLVQFVIDHEILVFPPGHHFRVCVFQSALEAFGGFGAPFSQSFLQDLQGGWGHEDEFQVFLDEFRGEDAFHLSGSLYIDVQHHGVSLLDGV